MYISFILSARAKGKGPSPLVGDLKVRWLEGQMDFDGTAIRHANNGPSMCSGSHEARIVRRMLMVFRWLSRESPAFPRGAVRHDAAGLVDAHMPSLQSSAPSVGFERMHTGAELSSPRTSRGVGHRNQGGLLNAPSTSCLWSLNTA